MSNLFGGSPRTQDTNPPATSLRIQTSAQGAPIPIGWGMNRLAPNLLWYAGFLSSTVQQSSAGGKGFGGGNSGKGGGGQTQTYYQWDMILGLCEGPVDSVGFMWVDKNIQSYTDFGMRFYNGSYTQVADSAVTTFFPAQARANRGISYLISFPFANATSAQIPGLNVEVRFGTWPNNLVSGPGFPDSNAADVIKDVLTNVHYGVGFPNTRFGDVSAGVGLSTFFAYGQAVGIWISPILIRQVALNSFLGDIMNVCVAEPVWSGGKLKVVPYYDAVASANGYTFTPNTTPIYDLTDDDFIIGGSGGSSYDSPVVVKRKAATDKKNSVKVSYSSRNNQYSPTIVEAKDDAGIQQFGLNTDDPRQYDMICQDGTALICAHLQLGREQVMNQYEFTVGARFVLLEPMDCVTITDAHLQLVRQLVRIKEISENDDHTFSIQAEEVLIGAASPPLYGQQANAGFVPNFNSDPGLTFTPFFFEPADELANGLEVWMAVSGQNLDTWGGCLVYASYDAVNFQYLGRQLGPARMGVLTAPLGVVTAATNGPTIDTTNTLSVDLTMSRSQLLTGTFQDLVGLATLCYVNGEFLAYQNAASTGSNKYNLTTLSRGAYGTAITASSTGATFVRCDGGVFRIPFTQDRIGQTLYIKLVSFNHYGGGPQSLSTVSPFTYVIQGTALASPLPSITSFTSVYSSGVTQLSWTEITDFRPVLYEIRKGSSWDAASPLGRFAHPPVPTLGDGTYWIKAVSTPVAGLTVYSSTAASISISGSVLPLNPKASWDEQATLFSGSYSGNIIFDGNFVRTAGSGDILGVSDVFAIADAGDAIVTISIASPGVVTWTGHGRVAGDQVAIATTGNLPTPLVPIQTYFVKTVLTADTFTLSATNGGAVINTSGAQSGVHHAYAFGDVFAFGPQGSGIYQIPTSHEIDIGYVAPCLVAISFTSSGVPVSQNFFAYNPLFNITDFFGAISNQFVSVFPEISLSQDGVTFGPWFTYQAGVYNARKFRARMQIITNDGSTIAFLTSFVFTVYVPTRVDNWAIIGGVRTSLNNLGLLASGTVLTFLPDTQQTAAPFNGGVSNIAQPSVVVTILNSQPGDIVLVSNPLGATVPAAKLLPPTLSGCFVQVLNNGVGVARSVNIRPEGF